MPQDARFDSIFGLNGIVVDPTQTKLVFAMTGALQPGTPAQGIIYTLPLQAATPQPSTTPGPSLIALLAV